MAKLITQYVCQQCGRNSAHAFGRCPQCGSFNSMVEEVIEKIPEGKSSSRSSSSSVLSKPRTLAQIEGDNTSRIPLAMGEFARVLGGGVVPGSIILVGGDPGIGKSTLMLQVALLLADQLKVLYVSGEESEQQIKMRAARLLPDNRYPEKLYLVTETSLESIEAHIRELKPEMLVIDSIQTTYRPELDSSAGSVSQVRETASRLRELAKTQGIAVFVIGHVTKEGVIAGPRVLEHIVDTVLYLEGDSFQSFRLLRSVKNRFGATSEVGVFEMQERGMKEVPNPSEAFLAERMVNAAGSAIAVTMEGTRPLLVEIQGLTSHTSLNVPRRTPNGVDMNRLLMVSAVLTRRVGLRLADQDVFVNVVGGLRIGEPAADLAMAAAIASSQKDLPLRADTVFIGEVGLSGELRWVSQMETRLREAAKMGFKMAIIPKRLRRSEPLPDTIGIVEARSLRQALDEGFKITESRTTSKGKSHE